MYIKLNKLHIYIYIYITVNTYSLLYIVNSISFTVSLILWINLPPPSVSSEAEQLPKFDMRICLC